MYDPKQSGWHCVINYCFTKHYDKLLHDQLNHPMTHLMAVNDSIHSAYYFTLIHIMFGSIICCGNEYDVGKLLKVKLCI